MPADSTHTSIQAQASIKSLTGLTVTPDRLQELIQAYAPILGEIAKLRELDLTQVHPAVIFEPTAAYRSPR